MTPETISKALQSAVGEKPKSRLQIELESAEMPKIIGLSPRLRAELFRLDDKHHPLVGLLTSWGEWFFRKALNNDRRSGTWLVVSGPVGTGKSTVSRRLAKALSGMAVDASLGGWRGTVPMVWRGAWAAISSQDKNKDFEEAIADLKTAHIVFLDDVGVETDPFKSGEPTARLKRVLDICEKKWLFITTNLTMPLIAAKYDHRVHSCFQMAHWCDLAGMPDYRSKIPKTT